MPESKSLAPGREEIKALVYRTYGVSEEELLKPKRGTFNLERAVGRGGVCGAWNVPYRTYFVIRRNTLRYCALRPRSKLQEYRRGILLQKIEVG